MYKYYDTTIENLNTQLETLGVAVLPNILNNDEILELRNGIWKTLYDFTKYSNNPIKQEDSNSWITMNKLYPKNDMLIHSSFISHSQPIWNIRQHPNVINAFCKIWNCHSTELITSFDGISFHLPPERANTLPVKGSITTIPPFTFGNCFKLKVFLQYFLRK